MSRRTVGEMYKMMLCRSCGEAIDPDLAVTGSPNLWSDLRYRCRCGAGFSNAQIEATRRLIWKDPLKNVPEEVRDGLLDTLKGSANERNRPQKLWKFASESSEDAVTWTVFRALQLNKDLLSLANAIGLSVKGLPELVFWGAGTGRVATELRIISDLIGENRQVRTEPDVVLRWENAVIVVEAKFGSRNDSKPQSEGKFALYLNDTEAFDQKMIQNTPKRHYQLARNWRFLVELMRRFQIDHGVLINLAPPRLREDIEDLRPILRENENRRIMHLCWKSLLPTRAPAWLEAYIQDRGLRQL